MKYRRRPVEIEAFQYKGNGDFEDVALPEWVWEAFENGTLYAIGGHDPLRVKTLNGHAVVNTDDFIIRGIQGELYPCDPDIFEQTYERVIDE